MASSRSVFATRTARDWLESRLTDTVNRLLVGVFNTNHIAVDFVVDKSITLEEGGEEGKDEDIIENSPADQGDQIAIQETAATEYERIARPDRVVSFPGYLLRHLEQKCIPADELSLYLGTRQSVYRNWTRSGEPPVMVQNISAWELLPFSNMSHRNLFRLINGRHRIRRGGNSKTKRAGAGHREKISGLCQPVADRDQSAADAQRRGCH